MASPALNNTQIEWQIPLPQTIGKNYGKEISFLNGSATFCTSTNYGLDLTQESSDAKIYIRMIQKITKDIKHFTEVKPLFSFYKSKIENSLSVVSELKADAYSAELTTDETLFMSIKKGESTYYIEQYLDAAADDTDDFVLTIFQGKQVITNRSGSLSDIFDTIQTTV